MHVFEKAGLGIAPFRLVRIEFLRYKACPECPSQPGTSCDYCGEGIVETCFIRDANGKEFKVGNVCVGKTGDRGLIDPMKVELNRLRTIARHEKDDARILKAKAALEADEALRATLTALPHPYAYHAEKGKTLLDSVNFLLNNAGRKGGVEAAKTVEKYQSEPMSEAQVAAAISERAARLESERQAAEVARLAEVEVEKNRKAQVKVENAWLTNVLTGNGGFVESMRRELEFDTLDRLNLSQRQMDILADIYGKSCGRGNSKAYWDGVSYFWRKAGRDVA